MRNIKDIGSVNEPTAGSGYALQIGRSWCALGHILLHPELMSKDQTWQASDAGVVCYKSFLL